MLLHSALQYLADNKVINAVEGFGAQQYKASLSMSLLSLKNTFSSLFQIKPIPQ